LTAPQKAFSACYQNCLVDRVGFDRQFDPFAAAVDDGEHRFLGAGDQHVVLELGHVLLRSGLFRERPRQHELGLEHGAGFLDQTIERGRHPRHRLMDRMALDMINPVTRV
jgi:hypothetical protein